MLVASTELTQHGADRLPDDQWRAAGRLAWAGYPWIVLIASSLVQTVASFGNQMISPLAPFLVQDLHLARTDIGLLVTAAYLGGVFVLVVAGRLSDRFGVRALFLVGM